MMARFAPDEQYTRNGMTGPAFVMFIRAVNTIRPETFREPVWDDEDRPGYLTEHYPTARVIHGPGDEGVRVVTSDEETADAFRLAARQMKINLAANTTLKWING